MFLGFLFSPYLFSIFVAWLSDLWATTSNSKPNFEKKNTMLLATKLMMTCLKTPFLQGKHPLWSSTFQQNQEMDQKKHLDPRKLTWNLKIPLWKRGKSYKPPICGFHVSFPGVKQSVRFIPIPTIPQISENCRKLPVQMGEITTVSMFLPSCIRDLFESVSTSP